MAFSMLFFIFFVSFAHALDDRGCILDPVQPPCWGALGRCTVNQDGSLGGFLAATASVEEVVDLNGVVRNRPYLEKSSQICDFASVSGDAAVTSRAQITGNARVKGNARVGGSARVYGEAQIFGSAQILDQARVFGESRIFGNALISGSAWVFGRSRVYESAVVAGDARVFDDAWIFGQASVIEQAHVYGYSQVNEEAWISGTAHLNENAWVFGNSWVAGNSRVSGSARILGHARIYGDAYVYQNARIYDDARIYDSARIFGAARIFGDVDIAENSWVFGDKNVFQNLKEPIIVWSQDGITVKKYSSRDVSFSHIEKCIQTVQSYLNGVPEQQELCSICLETWSQCLELCPLIYTKCNHVFCKNCFDRTLRQTSRCPLCRGENVGQERLEVDRDRQN